MSSYMKRKLKGTKIKLKKRHLYLKSEREMKCLGYIMKKECLETLTLTGYSEGMRIRGINE